MNITKEYIAFISYSRKDIEWAQWLQKKLEFYKLPSFVTEEYPDKLKHLRPVFLDVTDLELGVLPDKIKEALYDSKFLIVICSPSSSKSIWVDNEVRTFVEMGRTKQIIPFIVDGVAHAKDPDDECLPPSLLSLKDSNEMLGANINELSRDYAVVKVVAAILGLKIDKLWQRYLRAEEEEKQRMIKERNHLLMVQSHYLAECSFFLTEQNKIDVAKLLALEALPKRLDEPNRPYVQPAEMALRNACYSFGRVLLGHTDGVNSVVYSADGNLFFSSSYNETIVWDAYSGKKIEIFEGCKTYFSQDGKYFILQHDFNTIEVWLYNPRKMISRISCNLEFFFSGAYSFSSDNRLFVVNNYFHSYTNKENNYTSFHIYDLFQGKKIKTIKVSGDTAYSHTLSPDNKLLAFRNENRIYIWDVNKDEIFKILEGHTQTVCCLTFSPDGKILASGSESPEQSINIWNVSTGQLIKTLTGHYDRINNLHFDKEGDMLVSSSQDGKVSLWNVSNGHCEITINVSSSAVFDARLLPDGKSIACASEDRTLYIFYLDYGSQYQILGANPHFVDNGKQLVTLYGSEQEETLLVYNFASGQMMSKITIRDLGYLQTISLNGKYAIFSKPLKNYSYQYILYNIDHSSVISKLGEGSEIKGADLSLDGRQFVFVDKGIIIGDTSTGLINKRLSHPDYHNGLNMIVDEQRWMYHGRARFSKDNRYVVYEDRAIIEIWDPAMEKIIWRKENGGNNTICNYCLNFHPETMRYVQAEESYIKMWDVKNNILLFSFIAHLGNILSVAFSNDGKRIISFGEDNKIKLWNAETGKNLFDLNSNIFVNFDGLDYSLDHVFFSFDDSKIICSSLKGTTVVWDYPPLQKLIDDTTEQYKNRPLTAEEKRDYLIE